jgi:hypothetical protein
MTARLHSSDRSIEPIADLRVSEILADDLLDTFARTPRLATVVPWAG